MVVTRFIVGLSMWSHHRLLPWTQGPARRCHHILHHLLEMLLCDLDGVCVRTYFVILGVCLLGPLLLSALDEAKSESVSVIPNERFAIYTTL